MMKCRNCSSYNNKILTTKPTMGGEMVRRMRECQECETRFTTYEVARDTFYEKFEEVDLCVNVTKRNEELEDSLLGDPKNL